MDNVFEITITKEVMKTETFTELVKFGDVSNQQKEDLVSSLKREFGEGEEGVTINLVSTPTEKEPEKYFGGVDEYAPSLLFSNNLFENYFHTHTKKPRFWNTISFPENTKSVLAYRSQGHRSTTLLPNDSLLFYFSIEKKKVVDLLKKGKIKELQKHNIIPKERNQWNLLNLHRRVLIHPNHSVLIKEIYKRWKKQLTDLRKNLIGFLAVFTCDEWIQVDEELVGISFCSHKTNNPSCLYNTETLDFDPDTNEPIFYHTIGSNVANKCRVGTYKSTTDEKGNLRAMKRGEKLIINYDNENTKKYLEELQKEEEEVWI